MFLQYNEMLNPVYYMSSDSIVDIILETFSPLTVAIWGFDPLEIPYFIGQRKRDYIVLQQIHRRDMLRALSEVWRSLS